MSVYVGRNERQKEIAKLYEKLCHRYSRYEVWQDMVTMIACSISNAVDKRHFDKREEMYLRAARKYEHDEIEIFPEIFVHIVEGMEAYPDCDFLGEMYMNLELGNSSSGQFFTPYSICQMMTEITIQDDLVKAQVEKHGWISVSDPACGAGATLVAAANHLRRIGVNYQTQALFAAQDIDMTVALMCYTQLSLMGCAGYVVIGDSLREPMTGNALFGEESARCWYTPMFFSDVWNTRRAIENFRLLFKAVATPLPAAEQTEAYNNMPQPEPPAEANGAPPMEKANGMSDAYVPTLTVCADKKHAGQIMFDFGMGG